MAKVKNWSGGPGRFTGPLLQAHHYPSLWSVFPPSTQFDNTLLHVRLQAGITVSATRVSGTNTPTSFAWDDLQICIWTWLNRQDGELPLDFGPDYDPDTESDKRILSMDTLTLVSHYAGTNPTHEASFYALTPPVSVESRRQAVGAESSPFSVDVGVNFYGGEGYIGVESPVGGIQYEISGTLMLRALWHGDDLT